MTPEQEPDEVREDGPADDSDLDAVVGGIAPSTMGGVPDITTTLSPIDFG